MIISEAAAEKITSKVLALSRADSSTVTVAGHERGNIRFALNSATTSGSQQNLSLSIESNFGSRSGQVSLNDLEDSSIAAAVRKSEELARLAPENPEFQTPLGKQSYLKSRAYFERTARARADKLAALCRPALSESMSHKVSTAGYLESGASCLAMATSNGLFAYEKSTSAGFTVTSRINDGGGSGWAGTNQHDIALLDTARLSRIAVRKCLETRHPETLPPGKYTVLLEPSAVCDLLVMMIGHFNARSADEGRSFFSKKGGANKIGEKLFGDHVTLFSDPHHPLAPGSVFEGSGLPVVKRNWVEEGGVKELIYSRYWAGKAGHEPVPHPTNLIMTGGTTSTEQMIASVQKGVLVTRLWYIREVDPRTLLFTGLTRDGTFLIENGKIAGPIKNFRFNESPAAMLGKIEAMGPAERTIGSEVQDWPVCVPPLLVRDFTFSSLSDAV
jgi:predicted Zn-dependent protease